MGGARSRLRCRSLGFGPGQFGPDHGPQHPAHVIADLGIVHAGGTRSACTNTLAPEQVEYGSPTTLRRLSVRRDEKFLEKFLSIRASTPHLQHLVLIRGTAPRAFTRGLAGGQGQGDVCEVACRLRCFMEGSRSGRPGQPDLHVRHDRASKGVMYSHNNVAWTLESARRVLDLTRRLSELPPAGPRGRAIHITVGAPSTTGTRSTCVPIQTSCFHT